MNFYYFLCCTQYQKSIIQLILFNQDSHFFILCLFFLNLSKICFVTLSIHFYYCVTIYKLLIEIFLYWLCLFLQLIRCKNMVMCCVMAQIDNIRNKKQVSDCSLLLQVCAFKKILTPYLHKNNSMFVQSQHFACAMAKKLTIESVLIIHFLGCWGVMDLRWEQLTCPCTVSSRRNFSKFYLSYYIIVSKYMFLPLIVI